MVVGAVFSPVLPIFETPITYAATDIANDASLSTGLISYWELEEASGTRVDSHGPNDLTDNNTVTTVTGVQGEAANFTRANAETLSISDASQTDLDINSDFSFVAWFNPTTRAHDNGIISKYSSSANKRALALYIKGAGQLGSNPSNALQLDISRDGTGSNRSLFESSAEYITSGDIGNWLFVTATFDLSARTAVLYKNGSVVSHVTLNTGTLTSIQNNNLPFRLGDGNQVSDSDKASAALDEVGVWSRILTPTEVTALYNSGSGIPYDAGGGGAARRVMIIN